MLELLSRLNPGDLAGVLIVAVCVGLGLFLIVVVTVAKLIAYNVRRHQEQQLATTLIVDMLESGLSADDIVRILSVAGFGERRFDLVSLGQKLGEKLTPSTSGSEEQATGS